MKKLLISLLTFMCAFCAFGQSVAPPTSYEAVTIFGKTWRDTETSMVVTQRIGIAHDILGWKGTYIDFRGYGGFNISTGNAATGGLTLAGNVSLAREISLNFGPAISFTAGQRPKLGIFFGLRFNWGK